MHMYCIEEQRRNVHIQPPRFFSVSRKGENDPTSRPVEFCRRKVHSFDYNGARGVKLLSSLSTFSLTRAQLSRSVFIEKCCEMIARFSISGTASTKNRSRVYLKIECDAAIDALCVLSGSDEDGAKLLLRSCKINIIGLLVDCYEHADNIFDETVHDENEIDDADDDEKDEDEATPSSFLLTKRQLLLLFHNLSFAGDVAKAHFCAKTKSLDVLIESIENSFDAESALLGSAALLSLARRGARVLAALRRGDREERLRRCSRVLGERVAFLNASSPPLSPPRIHYTIGVREKREDEEKSSKCSPAL